MARPHNAPYKVAQRKSKEAVKRRGKVLHVSCQLVPEGSMPLFQVKQKVQGTRIGSFTDEEIYE